MAIISSPSPHGLALSLFYNLINFNFHHFSNSSSHCPRPPTHQPWTVRCRLFFSATCWEMCQSRLKIRGPPRDTCAASYSQTQSRRKWKQLAWTRVHLWTGKKNTHTYTQRDISVRLKDRDGEIQSPPTDGYHASGKEQVWTTQSQLLPKQRGIRGVKTMSTSSMYTEWMCGKTDKRWREKSTFYAFT